MREPWVEEMNHQAQLEREMEALPKCADCGYAITDEDCYETFDGRLMCWECFYHYVTHDVMEDRRRNVEDIA